MSSEAHVETMRAVKGGQREHLAEATFKYKAGSVLPLEASMHLFRFPSQAALRGCFRVGYSCICGSGRRCSAEMRGGFSAFCPRVHSAEPRECYPPLRPRGRAKL